MGLFCCGPLDYGAGMTGTPDRPVSRRAVISAGGALGALLLLPGCAGGSGELGGMGSGIGGLGGAFSPADVLRRLLTLSAQNAFTRLGVAGVFWSQQMAGLDLAKLTGGGSNTLSRMLTSGPFKGELEQQFAGLAAEASKRAAPVVASRARNLVTSNATALLRRRPGGATRYLRRTMGDEVLDAIVPELARGLGEPGDLLLAQLASALDGLDVEELAQRLGREIENAIWEAIAEEESAIRAEPERTRDLLLIRAFGAD